MSGLLAVLGSPAEERVAAAMFGALRARGASLAGSWAGEPGLLGVCRHEWEMGPDFAGGTLVLETDGVIVAADASLYYRDDLRRALKAKGVRPEGVSVSHLLAAAYQAWGSALVDWLEGDYAFVLCDRRTRRVVAARDPGGSRPLFFAWRNGRLILASRLSAVVEHPAVSRELNRAALAEDVVCTSSCSLQETVFQQVEQVPAGARLVWEPGRPPVVQRFWTPPVFEQEGGPDASNAAEQLRAVLGAAVRERLALDAPTAVWTSGGYDSTAIFALARRAAGQAGRAPAVPVSMSYPEGDPGREDELIEAMGRFTGSAIQWLRIADVPGLPDPVQWAAGRDLPFAHPYQEWNRALARGSVAAGARVVLSGNGGDQFFSVSPVFLADLLRQGRLGEMYREARAIGLGPSRFRDLFHWALQPALPAGLRDLVGVLRGGRHLRPHLVTPVPGWLGMDGRLVEQLRRRQWDYGLRRAEESFGSAESAWYFTTSFGPRICGVVMDLAQQEGAEVRSPFYDRRVLEFMSRRPRTDRFTQGENKLLLRQALAGLLPPEILARRTRRTGLPSTYLNRVLRGVLPTWSERTGSRLQLEELGIVGRGAGKAGVERYLAHPRWDGSLGPELFHLFSAEFWLREHLAGSAAPAVAAA